MRPRIVFMLWDGEVFKPTPPFTAYCNREYVVGEVYPMAPIEERSKASHDHYFAALQEAFDNLSEENAKQFPSSEHLRHWALIQLGYCTECHWVMADNNEARRLAIDLRRREPYAVLTVRGRVVHEYLAESQSRASMKKERFQQSKTDVLDLVASMARTSRVLLMKNAGRTA